MRRFNNHIDEVNRDRRMDNYQLTTEDIIYLDHISKQPNRIAYIDECGSFGFDWSKAGTSRYYVLTAVVVEKDKVAKLHQDFDEIKRSNGFANQELKSSKVSDPRRKRIMAQLLPLEFCLVIFISDKELYKKGTPLTEYKKTFIKNMNNRMHRMLYNAYPKLTILMDEFGYPEYQESFKKYVSEQRTQLNIFNEYDFDFVDSKDETLVQIADFIGGSIVKRLLDPDNQPNYLEMIKGKITALKKFPEQFEPFWGHVDPSTVKYDGTIFALSVKLARDFITQYAEDQSEERKAQIAVLEFLLFHVEISPTEYVYADKLVEHLSSFIERRPTKSFLFRRVIAPLRDHGVILASCNHGYKIPISVEDINTYLNQTTSTVGPMLSRMETCRQLILQGTDGTLDVFEDEAFIRYKRLFE